MIRQLMMPTQPFSAVYHKNFDFQAFDMLVSRGDNVLVETPCYPGTLTAVSINKDIILSWYS
jgi:DNA-binding transcriptional MocR family regulator